MSFWEILKQVCAAFGATVARWFSVAWKTRPLAAAIKNERKLIQKRYAQLGERYYDKCAEGIIDDGALAYLVRDVNTSRARIEEYIAAIAELRQRPLKPLLSAKEAEPVVPPVAPEVELSDMDAETASVSVEETDADTVE